MSPQARRTWGAVLAYVGMLSLAGACFQVIRWLGEGATTTPVPDTGPPVRVDVVFHVLATLAAVIALGYVLGRLCKRVGQPVVIGEILAGILLGPSLLGVLWPEAQRWLIPDVTSDPGGQVVAALTALAQLGVVLYLFLIGLDLNGEELRAQARVALAVSHTSIAVQFVLGAALALWLYPLVAPPGVSFTSFALFFGVALSVAAFPVLASILTERRLANTPLGVLAFSCAATDEVTAWTALALVIGVTRAQVGSALFVLAGAVGFVAVLFLMVRPLVARLVRRYEDGPLPSYVVPGLFVAVLLAALTTHALGLHAVFGAFLFGVVVPHESRVARVFSEQLRAVVTGLLLPAFFAVAGLHTRTGLLTWELALPCVVLIVVATVGKCGGTILAARWCGLDWRTALALGTLLNTRGLMGLIVLNVGLDLGVISPALFAMMVVMALATTLATVPILARLAPSGPGH